MADAARKKDRAGGLGRETVGEAVWGSTLTALMIIDPGSKQILDINSRGVEMFGVPRDKILGNNCHRFICPAEAGHCPITDHGKEVDHSERRMLNAAGEHISILKTVSPIHFNGQILLLESFVDIEDLKQGQRALRKSRNFIQAVVDGIGDPVLVIDPENHDVILANRAAMLHSSAGEQYGEGMKCCQVSHNREEPCPPGHGSCPLHEVVKTKRSTRTTHVHINDGARERTVDIVATPVMDDEGGVIQIIQSKWPAGSPGTVFF